MVKNNGYSIIWLDRNTTDLLVDLLWFFDMMVIICEIKMELRNALLVPLRYFGGFFIKYGYGGYSLPVSFLAAFFLFTFSSVFLDVSEQALFTEYACWNHQAIQSWMLGLLIIYIQAGLWFSSHDTYWLFKLCIRLLIINNSVILGVFLLVSFGVLHVDTKPVMHNPNVPVRIR